MKAIDLKEIFESGQHKNVQAYLNFLDPLEIVDLFYIIDQSHYQSVIDNLDEEELAEIFPLFEKSLFDKLIELLSIEQITSVFNLLETDDAASLLKTLPDDKKSLVLPNLTKVVQINRILSYPEDSAGSIMQTEVCLLTEGMSVKEAVAAIRRQKKVLGKVVVSYVVDEERKLIGLVLLDDIILSQMTDPISKITKPLKHYVNPEEDQEEVAQIFSKYDVSYLPVVDHDGILLGQIMFDDIQDVIEEEASEDILAYVGVSADESIGDINPNRLKLALGRFPWLIFSISASFVTGYILTFFEGNVTNAIIFASFVPLIMNTTGNVGTQTAMIITRSFALGANEFGHFRLPLMRELSVGLIMGLMAGVTTFSMILLFYGDSTVGIRVGSTLVLSMSTAALFGMLIPMSFKKLGIDPAIASGPLVTSFCDMLSVSMYLGIILSLGKLFP